MVNRVFATVIADGTRLKAFPPEFAAFVIGGPHPVSESRYAFSSGVEMLDLSAGKWLTKADVPRDYSDPNDEYYEPHGCYESACAWFNHESIGPGIMVCGGQMCDGNDTTAHIYMGDLSDGGESKWFPLPSLRNGRARHACASLGHVVYAVGGAGMEDEEWSDSMASMEFLDLTHRLAAEPMPCGRSNLRLVSLGAELYAIGGDCDHQNGLNTVDAYDPALNKWRSCAPLLAARTRHGAAAWGNSTIYVAGGVGPGETVAEVYSCVTNEWTTIAPAPQPGRFLRECEDYALHLCTMDDGLYVFGGKDFCCNALLRYDPRENRWNSVSVSGPYQSSRKGHYPMAGVTTISGEVLY